MTLKDLLEGDLLQDFLDKFGDFVGLTIRLIDEKGNIVSGREQLPLFCSLVTGNESNIAFCDESVGECAWIPIENGKTRRYKCFCGLQYVVAPLSSEFDIRGRAIIGPFRNKDTSISERVLNNDVSKSEFDNALDSIPCRDTEEVERAGKFFASIMNIFLFLGVKRILTSRIHMETIFRARDDIFREMESQMNSAEDREELERLKQIF